MEKHDRHSLPANSATRPEHQKNDAGQQAVIHQAKQGMVRFCYFARMDVYNFSPNDFFSFC
jgi:hypothetical protein